MIALTLLVLLTPFIYFYTRQIRFGAIPKGTLLKRIKKSPHYHKRSFKNLTPTSMLTNGATFTSVLREFLFKQAKNKFPQHPLPTIKTDFKNLPPAINYFVWMGHSSYFLQIDGQKILVDPVMSGSASPVPNTNKAFKGADVYTFDDIPYIDLLIITHDHWDHLDYKTMLVLKPKIAQIVCPLGVSAHFNLWGFDEKIIREMDWFETAVINTRLTIHCHTARHFSGRGMLRNRSLWASFILAFPDLKIFVGGDSGYGTHIKEIARATGPIDLAIMENGQYDKRWQHIHTLPHEFIQAATEINAKKIVPVHSCKFAMANHAWNEPIETVYNLNRQAQLPIIFPQIGQAVEITSPQPIDVKWWKEI